jgi:hypothetical protein
MAACPVGRFNGHILQVQIEQFRNYGVPGLVNGQLFVRVHFAPFFDFFAAFFAPASFVGLPGFGCHCGKVSTADSGTIHMRKSPMVCGTAPGTWPLRSQVATVVYGFLICRANSPAVIKLCSFILEI